GSLAGFNFTKAFTTDRMSAGGAVSGGHMYLWGGITASASFLSSVESQPINNGGSGQIGSWQTWTFPDAQSLPQVRQNSSATAINGFLYVTGGCSNLNCAGGSTTDTTYYAKVSSDGLVDPNGCGVSGTVWCESSNDFTTARAFHQTVGIGGYLY